MVNAAVRLPVSYADYVAAEARSAEKHQYVDGAVFSMAGGTYNHSMIGGAIIALLNSQLRGKPCRASNSDLRVRIAESRVGTYPDVTVVCGAPMFAADDPHAVTNPTVITEVLSDGTEAFDRGEKFGCYRTLESLREYILVSQYAFCIERFVRNADNSWTLTVFGAGQSVQLASIGCELAVDDVYAGLVLELRPFADTR
jgi:Uma2 family endonuclease